jgi:micrococcal nuclease
MRCIFALLVASCIGLAAACAGDTPAPSHTVSTTALSTSSTATALTATPRFTVAPSETVANPIDIPYPSEVETATVVRVVDGDTIHVELNGTDYALRYIGIDAPETVDPNRPDGCYGREASDHNKELVEGRQVELEKDVSNIDEFGRLLRYVWLDHQMVNALLVRDGYAKAETDFPESKHRSAFLQLQAEARATGRGVWGPECSNATPVGTTTQTPPPGEGSEICDFSGTTQPVIKGNISSSDAKIYHVPGQDSYDETGITESRGERWFCTEQEAVDAGWRKSKS